MDNEVVPPTKMSKDQLRQALLDAGYTEENLQDTDGKNLKRPDLLEKLKDHLAGADSLEALVDVAENDGDEGVAVTPDDKEGNNEFDDDDGVEASSLNPPEPHDAEWTQYVLGKFQPDEVDGMNPRVEGLRRIAGELVGVLLEEGCDLVAVPCVDNNYRACVKAWGVFQTKDGYTRRFEALADAHDGNCLEDYATYLVAMADTRAKGRMFRNALGLRRVVSAEEVSKTIATSADVQPGGAIHSGQISMIRIMVDRHGLNLIDILDGLGIKHEINEHTADVNLQKLTYEDALGTTKKIREIVEEKGSE